MVWQCKDHVYAYKYVLEEMSITRHVMWVWRNMDSLTARIRFTDKKIERYTQSSEIWAKNIRYSVVWGKEMVEIPSCQVWDKQNGRRMSKVMDDYFLNYILHHTTFLIYASWLYRYAPKPPQPTNFSIMYNVYITRRPPFHMSTNTKPVLQYQSGTGYICVFRLNSC